uniref:sigma 54-interacting transcriptional regulator n=1 Tax=Malonomonas rubra TaxID=57040 RepID=UPI0026ED1675
MKKKQTRSVGQENSLPGSGSRYELDLQAACSWDLLQPLIVCVQLPGIEEKQLDIRLAGNVLTIKEAEPRALQLSDLQRSEIVGNSQALKACLDQVAAAAQSEACVLVCGETGTGKELFARAIHQNSSRNGKNFVVVDCRSIPESIAEKLILGHAGEDRFGHSGLLSQANRGTLFLDEVADLPSSTQKLFCQLLQDGKYRPVGPTSDVRVEFRLVSATNRNLRRMVAQGKFNPELYTLIQPLLVEVPP